MTLHAETLEEQYQDLLKVILNAQMMQRTSGFEKRWLLVFLLTPGAVLRKTP